MEKIKVSAVSYLNTIPFRYGMENSPELLERIELSRDIPSRCASKLENGEAEVGLIPVAAIPQIKAAEVISDYCIGATGKVHTVLLCSQVPLNEISSIQLDYQSRTSVALCKILCKEHWKISPEFKLAEPGYENKLEGNEAGVIIGDRTFFLDSNYPFQYDLSEAWFEMTGLPFVFATWVSNKKMSDDFLHHFNKALKFGLEHIQEAIDAQDNINLEPEVLQTYLNKQIEYKLDEPKKKAMALFLDYLKKMEA